MAMTPEHKAKMAAGRERAKAERDAAIADGTIAPKVRQSRGRPALRAEAAPLPREVPIPHISGDPTVDELERAIAAVGDGSRVTRQARGMSDATFDIPMQGRREGWDYEWKTVRVNGEEVDPSSIVEYQQGGWNLVPRTHFPSLVPPGWKKPYIERWGMQLFMRPMHLSKEASEELRQHAFNTLNDRLSQAAVGEVGVSGARNFDQQRNRGIQADRGSVESIRPGGRQSLL